MLLFLFSITDRMAVNEESSSILPEAQTSTKNGINKDGSLVCDENDYCLQFMRNFQWDKPVQRTPSDFPWITPKEFEESYTYKYLNYQMEEGYIGNVKQLLILRVFFFLTILHIN